jgi:hypothetical protein
MRHIKTLLVLTIMTMAVMSGGISNRNQTLAADFSCTTATCPGMAQCSGDHWTQSGTCQRTCYRESGTPGQIVFSGSANCSPPTSNGSGGSGGGSSGSGSEGGYCADNWWWDFNCSGPDDPYEPLIN